MYGTREDLCRMLNEQYPAETPLNLIIWTPADIEALADGMEYSFSEHDVRAVLERMDTIRGLTVNDVKNHAKTITFCF